MMKQTLTQNLPETICVEFDCKMWKFPCPVIVAPHSCNAFQN